MTLDERIGRYLDKCPPAVSGQGGHDTAFRVAVALAWGFGLEPEAAYPYFERYNATCAPPWTAGEIRHKLSDAAKMEHKKPRGHLLAGGGNRQPEAFQKAPKLVPVRLTPRKWDSRTVRTVFSNPYAHACTHTCVYGTQKQSSEPSGTSLQAFVSDLAAELVPLVPVPGCNTGRPPELDVADDTWRAVVAAGFADEPAVQATLALFGPGCTVPATGEDVL